MIRQTTNSSELLGSAFATARAHIVRFPNPLTEAESESTVYVACKASD